MEPPRYSAYALLMDRPNPYPCMGPLVVLSIAE